jgi:arylsulfatase A-like enzyme
MMFTLKKTSVWISALLLLLAAIWLAISFPNQTSKKAGLNVVLITLDTTRPDHLGYNGYGNARTTNIDCLAEQGVAFAQAIAPLPITLPSHCSMLTGLEVFSHGLRDNGTFYVRDDITTLAEILKKKGYKTAAVIASFVLDKRFNLNQGFDFYEDELDNQSDNKNNKISTWVGHSYRRFDRPASEVSRIASDWLEKNYKEKFFLWVHFYDPHQPYNPPPQYKSEIGKEPHQSYDGEIAYMDHELGKLINKIKEKNLTAKTLIVVASDHGEALGEHDKFIGHGFFTYEEEIKSALIFVLPGFMPKTKKIHAMVSLASVTPTILDILGMKANIKFDAKSLYPRILNKEKKNQGELYCETIMPEIRFGKPAVHALRTDKFKIVYKPKPKSISLYKLDVDPFEKNNIFDMKNKSHFAMFSKLLSYIKKIESIKNLPTKKMDEETREKLRSLGYIR